MYWKVKVLIQATSTWYWIILKQVAFKINAISFLIFRSFSKIFSSLQYLSCSEMKIDIWSPNLFSDVIWKRCLAKVVLWRQETQPSRFQNKSSRNLCLPNSYFISYFALSRKTKSRLSLPQKHETLLLKDWKQPTKN